MLSYGVSVSVCVRPVRSVVLSSHCPSMVSSALPGVPLLDKVDFHWRNYLGVELAPNVCGSFAAFRLLKYSLRTISDFAFLLRFHVNYCLVSKRSLLTVVASDFWHDGECRSSFSADS